MGPGALYRRLWSIGWEQGLGAKKRIRWHDDVLGGERGIVNRNDTTTEIVNKDTPFGVATLRKGRQTFYVAICKECGPAFPVKRYGLEHVSRQMLLDHVQKRHPQFLVAPVPHIEGDSGAEPDEA